MGNHLEKNKKPIAKQYHENNKKPTRKQYGTTALANTRKMDRHGGFWLQ